MPSIHLRLLRLALNALKKQNHGVFWRAQRRARARRLVCRRRQASRGRRRVSPRGRVAAGPGRPLLRDRGYMPGTTTRSPAQVQALTQRGRRAWVAWAAPSASPAQDHARHALRVALRVAADPEPTETQISLFKFKLDSNKNMYLVGVDSNEPICERAIAIIKNNE